MHNRSRLINVYTMAKPNSHINQPFLVHPPQPPVVPYSLFATPPSRLTLPHISTSLTASFLGKVGWFLKGAAFCDMGKNRGRGEEKGPLMKSSVISTDFFLAGKISPFAYRDRERTICYEDKNKEFRSH